MDDLEANAISAINEYLISLLRGKEFCKARRVGEALKILVESNQSVTEAPPTCEDRIQERR